MNEKLNKPAVVVFDLDDTLYKEIDYLRSAYQHISQLVHAETGKWVFEAMWDWYCAGIDTFSELKNQFEISLSISDLVYQYRFHAPEIALSEGAAELLNDLSGRGVPLGLITDGRTKTQTNKLLSLGIASSFERTVISESFGSEKPEMANYRVFEQDFPNSRYYYIGDNFSKDFVSPNKLGWTTIGLLDDGRNIHSQDREWPNEYHPQFLVRRLHEIEIS